MGRPLGLLAFVALLGTSAFLAAAPGDPPIKVAPPLASWRDSEAKKAVTDFVIRVTDEKSSDFVPPAERIAVFDNDGTLWCEQPLYVQLQFAIDRVRALAPAHPEWARRAPFQAALDGDLPALAKAGEHGLVELITATHAGMSDQQFAQQVAQWLAQSRHPRFGRPYADLVYQPMIELLGWLRTNGFRTWIVSGGGIEFVRVFSESRYGVGPEQVIGSTIRTRYAIVDGEPRIERLAEIDFIDDKAGKPVAIARRIGRRPIAAFGNSDGDFEMLEWTTSAPGARLGMLIRHDDADREYAYDRQSAMGRLARGLDEAPARGWTVTSMRQEWRSMFPARAGR